MIEEQLQNLIAAQQEANRLLAFIAKNAVWKQPSPEFELQIESQHKEEEKTEEPKEEKLKSKEEPPSIEDCRAALVEVSKKLGKSKAKELLGRFKAEKMGDVKEEDYLAFLNATKLSLEEA